MALFHHDGRSYDEAASDAAKRARKHLEEQIEAGKAKALAVIDKVIDETPTDKIVRVDRLEFDAKPNGQQVAVYEGRKPRTIEGADLVINPAENGWERLHRNALGQMAERAGIPMSYISTLENQGLWGKKLIAENLRQLFDHKADEKYLLRSVHDEVRGFLSNKYRRLNTQQLIETATKAFRELGLVPVDGIGTDTRIRIRALLPVVFEPVPGEVICYGLDWGQSDFGNGAHVASAFMDRLWCTNTGVMHSQLREVHLGARLTEDIAWSDRTYKLDSDRSASMLEDMIRGALSPAKVEEMNALIVRADAEKVESKDVDAYLKKNLTKGLAEKVSEAFRSNDVEMLPAGNTKWRLSNALSWIAQKVEDKEQTLDLQRLAGQVVEGLQKAA